MALLPCSTYRTRSGRRGAVRLCHLTVFPHYCSPFNLQAKKWKAQCRIGMSRAGVHGSTAGDLAGSLGHFSTEEDAAKAYDAFRRSGAACRFAPKYGSRAAALDTDCLQRCVGQRCEEGRSLHCCLILWQDFARRRSALFVSCRCRVRRQQGASADDLPLVFWVPGTTPPCASATSERAASSSSTS